MTFWNEISQTNLGYVLEKYQQFKQEPNSVDDETRAIFEQWGPPDFSDIAAGAVRDGDIETIVAASNLAQAIRTRGFLAARLDPLGSPPPGDPSLELETHALKREEIQRLPSSIIQNSGYLNSENCWRAIQSLRDIYSAATGYDYGHIHQPKERTWLREAAESRRFYAQEHAIDPAQLLERLTEVEVFEHFLHRFFPGKTRFSIEGLDMIVPMLDETIKGAAENEICMIFVGMAHRGRLNVLAHVLGKPYTEILAEFKDPLSHFPTWDEMGWTGDVKYHKGAQRGVKDRETVELVLCMPPNPSHLEHINPIIAGMSRSADSRADGAGFPIVASNAALPVLIHGDAGFTGEGIVAETLNMSQLAGYHVGGTIHIIANNQLGFTAEPEELRSSQFASDLAKGFEIPIIHVNADRPLACLEAIRTALAYRMKFHKDFVIDLIGYRRYGHNEGDEPTFTQPEMYKTIEEHPSVRALWSNELFNNQVIQKELPDELFDKKMQKLIKINQELEAMEVLKEPYPKPPPSGAAQSVETAVHLQRLKTLNETLLKIPDDFNLNPKIERAMEHRRNRFDDPSEPGIDWAFAEELALATILQDGIPIRFTGEDVVRGTFSQRHAIFYDVEQENRTYTPLHNIPRVETFFEIHNSPLTENATVGFEFGFNIQSPKRLVIWEAQYGDFINLAQIMIDEFVSSGRAKWGQTPSLVLLLPHGNEGQGPDHSSARPERFFQLAADINMRIANPTTAGQFFHLLRRQALLLDTDPLPLIVFTPKGLLRHPDTAVAPEALTKDGWRPIIDDPRFTNGDKTNQVQRVLLCSGRIYIDIINSDQYQALENAAVVRIEQLYPFPKNPLIKLLDRYPKVEEIDWIQEEPQNMGAWTFIRPYLNDLLESQISVHYIGRPPSSSPAEGSAHWYKTTQQALVKRALEHHSTDELIDSDVIKERI